jgi:hypothetical protein
MIHGSHHSDVPARASRHAGPNARRAKRASLMLSGLILVIAIAVAPAGAPSLCHSPTLVEAHHIDMATCPEFLAHFHGEEETGRRETPVPRGRLIKLIPEIDFP